MENRPSPARTCVAIAPPRYPVNRIEQTARRFASFKRHQPRGSRRGHRSQSAGAYKGATGATNAPCDGFSNRPVGVKRLQAIHYCSVDVARRLVLLSGIGTKALPSWDSKTRWNDLLGGLADRVGRSKRTCELTSSIVPRGTSFHRWVDSRVTSYSV